MTAPQIERPGGEGARGDRSADRRPRRDLAVVAGVAVGVRLLAAAFLVRDPEGLHDPFLYGAFARRIADGDGYVGLLGHPTTYYPPGYPLFLGVLQRLADAVGLGGHLPAVAAVAQACLGGVAAVATAVAARHLLGAAVRRSAAGPDPIAEGPGFHPVAGAGPTARRVQRLALVAGLVVALWPNFVLYGTVLLSETLFVALFAVVVASLLSLGDLRRLTAADLRSVPVLGGAAAFGAATLVRPQVLLVLPFVAVAWLVARSGWRRCAVGLGVLVIGAAAFVVPWTVRNAVVMGHAVPISTNGGDNLCIGFHDGATGGYDFDEACATEGRYVDGPDVEVAREGINRDRALDWASSNLTELPGLSLRKIWNTFSSDGDGLRAVESYEDDRFLPDAARTAISIVVGVGYVAVLVGAAVGLVAAVRRSVRREAAPLLLVGLTVAGFLVPALFFGDPRFKVAMVPCFALLVALGVDAALERRGGGAPDDPSLAQVAASEVRGG